MSTEEGEIAKAILISIAGSYPENDAIVSEELNNPQQLKRVLSRLDDATEDLKYKVQKIAQAHGLEWQEMMNREACKDSDVVDLENQSKAAIAVSMDPDDIEKRTNELIRARESLAEENDEIERVKQVVAHLQAFHSLYTDADNAILNMEFQSSIFLMDRSEDELRILRELVAEAYIVDQCIDRIGNLRLLASESLEEFWNSMVQVDKATASITIYNTIPRGKRSASILSICEGLEAMNTLDELAGIFSRQIEKHVLPHALNYASKLQRTGDTLSVAKQPEAPCLSLTTLLQFLSERLSPSAKIEVADSLSPAILKSLLEDTLPQSVPAGVEDLVAYGDYLAEVDCFEAFLSDTGFTVTSKLSLWTSMAKFEWLKSRESTFLTLAREATFSLRMESKSVERWELVRKAKLDTEVNGSGDNSTKQPVERKNSQAMSEDTAWNGEWENDEDGWHLDSEIVVEDPAPEPNGEFDEWKWDESPKKLGNQDAAQNASQVLERMKISSIPDVIIRLVHQILSEAINLQDSNIQKSAATPSVTDFLQIISSLVAIYRSLCSTCYTSIEIGGMVAYNDCLYLEEALSRIEKVEGKDCEALGMSATNSYRSEVAKHLVNILKELDKTDGFISCSQSVQSQVCESVVESLCRQIRDCATTWGEVLGLLSLYQAVGALLNATISRFIDDVQNIHDISERDSMAIASHISTLSTLEVLFPIESETSTVARYCPNWLKFQYLKEVLEGSLVDIMYLFHEGALVDFSNTELVQLLEALFAESEHRRKAVDEIRRS